MRAHWRAREERHSKEEGKALLATAKENEERNAFPGFSNAGMAGDLNKKKHFKGKTHGFHLT